MSLCSFPIIRQELIDLALNSKYYFEERKESNTAKIPAWLTENIFFQSSML